MNFVAWIDGTAILIAVIVVSGVGSVVDWRKEIEFVNRANEGQLANVVSSIYSLILILDRCFETMWSPFLTRFGPFWCQISVTFGPRRARCRRLSHPFFGDNIRGTSNDISGHIFTTFAFKIKFIAFTYRRENRE